MTGSRGGLVYPLSLLLLAAGCTAGIDELDEEVSSSSHPVVTFSEVSVAMQVKRGNNLCITAPASGTGPVTQQLCVGGPRQQWRVRQAPTDSTYFTIESMGNCLDVPNSSQDLGTNLILWECHRLSNQQFRMNRISGPSGQYQIQPKLAVSLGFCLDIEGGQPTVGAALQQFTCKSIDVDNQRFFVRPLLREEVLDCPREDHLHIAASGGVDDTIDNGLIAKFNGDRFSYWCTDDPEDFEDLDDPDDVYQCPVGTRTTHTVEISRLLPDRDQFRVRCFE